MPGSKDIQRRIKSVNSTKKITRAMEMVAATKMRRATEAVLRTRTYANLSWLTVLNLSKAVNGGNGYKHPLLNKKEEVKKVAIVLIASNRGLCGGYNSAIINKAHKSVLVHQAKENIETEFIIIGKKGIGIHQYFGYKVAAEFEKADVISEVKEILPVSNMIINGYLKGEYDKIMVAYTDYVSAIKQVPRIKQILPVDIATQDEYLGIVGGDTRVGLDKKMIDAKQEKYVTDDKFSYEYLFEPNPKEVLDQMIPRLIEVQLFQALLESNASEQSARMNAMHQATDAAKDMVNELTLYYNKARQAGITAEIAEISAGANALKN